MDMLRGQFLINHKEEAVMANDVVRDVQYVMYYFSASWCPPCQTFLPILKELYREARVRGLRLEIVFVPSDHNNDEMSRYFAENHGPWFAMPLGPLTAKLRAKYHVITLPTLIVVTKDGHAISKNARKELEDQGNDVLDTWFPESTE